MRGTAFISPYKGSGQITREQFLLYEMKITAKLMREGLNDGSTNLYSWGETFVYP